jgi:thiamine biosynthesis lipoprotein
VNSSPRLNQQMAALAGLGFQRAVSPDVQAEVIPVEGGRHKVTCTRPSMGTLVVVTAIHESSDLVQEAAGRAFEEMDRVVGLLNRYDPDSALSQLNAEGRIQGSPPELDLVLGMALRFYGMTSGAFDPTVQPLVDLFRGGVAREGELLHALTLVDGSQVEMGPREVRFTTPGMGITLDGIAKGYVVDVMAQVMVDHGLEHFLLNAGGDIRSQGSREDGEPWRVGVQDPAKEGDLPDVIALSGMAVATSGSYEIYFDPDRTHHHLISAETGTSPHRCQSVSVTASSALEADALATSVFIMKPEVGVAFIDSIPRCACLIVDAEGKTLRSTRWQSATDTTLPKAGSP